MPAPSLPTVDLMQPTEIAQPFHRAGWVYEEKYDGWRMVAYKRGDQVQLISRPGVTTPGAFRRSWRPSRPSGRPR